MPFPCPHTVAARLTTQLRLLPMSPGTQRLRQRGFGFAAAHPTACSAKISCWPNCSSCGAASAEYFYLPLLAAHTHRCSAVLPVFGISRPLHPSTSTAFGCCDPSPRAVSRTHLSTSGLSIHHGPMARFCFDKRPTISQLLRTFGRPRYMAYNVSEYMSATPLTYYDCHPILCTGLHGYLSCSPARYYGSLLVRSVILGYKMLWFLSSFIVNNDVCPLAIAMLL